MSMELCVLASGSLGNCSALRTPAGVILIDAGIGPRTTARRMAGTGVRLEHVRAICLTHLDRDHFNTNWVRTILELHIQVFCHSSRVEDVLDGCEGKIEDQVIGFDGEFEPLEGVSVEPLSLPHDALGSHGFVFEGFGCRIGYATDLGRVPRQLIERFSQLDVLAIESNYDPDMQIDSARPWFLKQRIMGGRGHLSNEQALAAVTRILDRHQHLGAPLPSHVVLLHRSRECNCPRLLRELFNEDPRIAARLTLAEQFERSDLLRAQDVAPLTGEQLMMAWG